MAPFLPLHPASINKYWLDYFYDSDDKTEGEVTFEIFVHWNGHRLECPLLPSSGISKLSNFRPVALTTICSPMVSELRLKPYCLCTRDCLYCSLSGLPVTLLGWFLECQRLEFDSGRDRYYMSRKKQGG
jgi:hypothetical protein